MAETEARGSLNADAVKQTVLTCAKPVRRQQKQSVMHLEPCSRRARACYCSIHFALKFYEGRSARPQLSSRQTYILNMARGSFVDVKYWPRENHISGGSFFKRKEKEED